MSNSDRKIITRDEFMREFSLSCSFSLCFSLLLFFLCSIPRSRSLAPAPLLLLAPSLLHILSPTCDWFSRRANSGNASCMDAGIVCIFVCERFCCAHPAHTGEWICFCVRGHMHIHARKHIHQHLISDCTFTHLCSRAHQTRHHQHRTQEPLCVHHPAALPCTRTE